MNECITYQLVIRLIESHGNRTNSNEFSSITKIKARMGLSKYRHENVLDYKNGHKCPFFVFFD